MSKRNNAKSTLFNMRIDYEDIENLKKLGEMMADNDAYGIIKSNGEVNLSAVIKYAYRQELRRNNIIKPNKGRNSASADIRPESEDL